MDKRDLAIIILSYNTRDITDKCLSYAQKSAQYYEEKLKGNVKIVVVDNASHDGSAKMIELKYPNVILFSLKKNLGFAGGNNYAMKRIIASNYLLLNSDAFLKFDTLYKSRRLLERNCEFSALGANLAYGDGSFQFSWGYLPTPLKTILWAIGFESLPFARKFFKPIYQHDQNFYYKKREIEWCSFAFFFLKREVFLSTGGFSEELFLYMEDVEWCERIRKAGFKICFEPQIKVIHLSGESSKNQKRKKLQYQREGLEYFHKTHYPKTVKIVQLFVRAGLNLRDVLLVLNTARSREVKDSVKAIQQRI